MATIKLKRGTSAPTTSNIVDGEIAVDKSSQKLYIRDGSTIKELGRRDSVPLSGGTMTGSLTMDSVALTTVQTSSESFADNNTSIMTSAAIDDRILSYGYSTTVGDITSVQISSSDSSISGTGTGSSGAISFDLEVATIDGGTY